MWWKSQGLQAASQDFYWGVTGVCARHSVSSSEGFESVSDSRLWYQKGQKRKGWKCCSLEMGKKRLGKWDPLAMKWSGLVYGLACGFKTGKEISGQRIFKTDHYIPACYIRIRFWKHQALGFKCLESVPTKAPVVDIITELHFHLLLFRVSKGSRSLDSRKYSKCLVFICLF